MKLSTFIAGLLSVIVVVATYRNHDDNVVEFEMLKANRNFLNLVRNRVQQKGHSRLTTFKYENCGNPSQEAVNITNLVVSPDPLVFPGTFVVNFAGTSKTIVQSPVKLDLLIQAEVAGIWIKIPCIDNVGSCIYDDVCQLLAQITQCPEPLVNAGIPCKCPYPQKAYNLSQASFQVDIPVLPPGNYHFVANLTNGPTSLTCVDLHATFS